MLANKTSHAQKGPYQENGPLIEIRKRINKQESGTAKMPLQAKPRKQKRNGRQTTKIAEIKRKSKNRKSSEGSFYPVHRSQNITHQLKGS